MFLPQWHSKPSLKWVETLGFRRLLRISYIGKNCTRIDINNTVQTRHNCLFRSFVRKMQKYHIRFTFPWWTWIILAAGLITGLSQQPARMKIWQHLMSVHNGKNIIKTLHIMKYIHAYIHTYIHIHTYYIHTYIHLYMYIHTYSTYIQTYIHTHTCTYI